LEKRRANLMAEVEVTPLTPEEAIGDAPEDFVIQKGKEQLIEARIADARGQAFTDHPSAWRGTLAEALDLDLSDMPKRAIFTAVLNAALRAADLAAGTVHCRDEDPVRCGPIIATEIERRYRPSRIGLIGLQPAILAGLVERFGAPSVRVVDRNPDNVGTTKCEVLIEDGDTELDRLVDWCDMGLATGSSVVNGTADAIADKFTAAGKPVVFYGNTIAGVAALLGLERLCPSGR